MRKVSRMSKELEALERLKTAPTFMGGTTEYQFCTKSETLLLQDYEIVKQALLELQSIKEANPSEALKCLEHIKKDDFNMIITTYPPLPAYNGVTKDEMFDKIEQALLKAEKEHKALEIIKKTKNIKVSFYENGSGKHYKIEFDKTRNQTITKEQFNLLKEVLE